MLKHILPPFLKLCLWQFGKQSKADNLQQQTSVLDKIRDKMCTIYFFPKFSRLQKRYALKYIFWRFLFEGSLPILMCCIIWFRVKTWMGNQITNFRFCTRVAPRKIGKTFEQKKTIFSEPEEIKIDSKERINNIHDI